MTSRVLSMGVLCCAALVASCVGEAPRPTQPHEAVAAAASVSSSGRAFFAPLRGAAEAPPNQSTAVGAAGFLVSPDGNSLQFQLLVGRLDNVTQAHIHLASVGDNGPVVAWLYPSSPPPQPIPGEFNGVLGEGTITAADLEGPLAGRPLSALVTALRNGMAYVNVHTVQFPPGEIRGQIIRIQPLD